MKAYRSSRQVVHRKGCKGISRERQRDWARQRERHRKRDRERERKRNGSGIGIDNLRGREKGAERRVPSFLTNI
jgi:hypothetical protein